MVNVRSHHQQQIVRTDDQLSNAGLVELQRDNTPALNHPSPKEKVSVHTNNNIKSPIIYLIYRTIFNLACNYASNFMIYN